MHQREKSKIDTLKEIRKPLVVVFEMCSVESTNVADRWSFYPLWIRDRLDSRLTPLFRSFLFANHFSHMFSLAPARIIFSSSVSICHCGRLMLSHTPLCQSLARKKMKSKPHLVFFRVRNHAVQLPNPQLCADLTQEVLKHDITVMKRASAFLVQKPKLSSWFFSSLFP